MSLLRQADAADPRGHVEALLASDEQEYLIAKAARVAGRWSFRTHEEERLEEQKAKAERKQRAQDRANARTRETERLAQLSLSDLALEGIECLQRKTDRTGRQLCLLVGK